MRNFRIIGNGPIMWSYQRLDERDDGSIWSPFNSEYKIECNEHTYWITNPEGIKREGLETIDWIQLQIDQGLIEEIK